MGDIQVQPSLRFETKVCRNYEGVRHLDKENLSLSSAILIRARFSICEATSGRPTSFVRKQESLFAVSCGKRIPLITRVARSANYSKSLKKAEETSSWSRCENIR